MAISCFCDHCGAENAPGNTICCACQKPLAQAEAHGTLLNERYTILSEIGAGGFGAVYKARDTQEHDRLVAVKQINLQGLSSQEIIEATDAFNREAEILTTLSHPLLPVIFDRFSDAEHWYLVMTYIDGTTLDEYLQQHQVSSLPASTGLPLGETLTIALELCDALHYLHSQQPPVIFRDLKPGNIMRTRKGRLYLIDFGIARRFKPGQAKDTIPFGSPGFAAPEQYGRAQTTPQADIYSLGALLYCLITGDDPSEHPFDFPPLPYSSAEGTQELNTLIQNMVALDSAKRPLDIELVQLELRHIQQLNIKANQQNHIWTPPQGQTPPADGGRQQHVFLNQTNNAQQRKRKTTRRAVITVGLILGGVALIEGNSVWGILHPPTVTTPASNWSPAPTQDTQNQNTVAQTPDVTATSTSAVLNNGPIFWSPDLSYAAVIDWTPNQIELYKIQGQQRIQTIKIPNNFTDTSISFYAPSNVNIQWSPDNSKILVLSNTGMIYVWNVANGQQLFTSTVAIVGDSATSLPIASWSPDGNYCAVSHLNKDNNAAYTVLHTNSGEQVFQTALANSNSSAMCRVAWSPDSRYMAFPDSSEWPGGTSWSASIWDRETSQKVNSFGGVLSTDPYDAGNGPFSHSIQSISWSPGGENLATFIDNDSLWVNQRTSNRAASVFKGDYYSGSPYGPIWSPDEKYVAMTISWELTIRNTSNWSKNVQLNGGNSLSQNAIVAFAWSADSKSVVVADQENNISSWSIG